MGRVTRFNRAVDRAMHHPKFSSFFDKRENFLSAFWQQVKNFLKDTIGNVIEKLLERFRLAPKSGIGSSGIPKKVILGVIIIVLFVTLLAIILTYIRRKKRLEEAIEIEKAFQLLGDKKLRVKDLLSYSDKAITENEVNTAVRYRYIALLWSMNEKDFIYVDPSDTNRVLLDRLLYKHPETVNRFHYVIDIYEQAWFGNKNVDEETVSQWLETYNDLLATIETKEREVLDNDKK